MKVKLQALKRQTYNTRHLEAGDVFDADKKFARVLIAQKRAKEHKGEAARPAAEKSPPEKPATAPTPPPAETQPSDLADLRAEYERVTGKRPFNGWDADELRARMAAHQPGEGGNAEDNKGASEGND